MDHSKTHIPKRPGEPENLQGDISKIKKLLNWAPKVSIEKGIKIMVSNIIGWKSAPVWTRKDKKSNKRLVQILKLNFNEKKNFYN